jgi:hypothetical protein
MRIRNELERHRARRTLNEVKRKLEEALRLSEELQRKGQYDRSTSSYRHR